MPRVKWPDISRYILNVGSESTADNTKRSVGQFGEASSPVFTRQS